MLKVAGCKKINKLIDHLVAAIGSRITLLLIAVLLVLQSLWVALFFRHPLLYDELYHYNAIQAFSHYLWPIVINQSTQFDYIGSMTFGNVSLYHYLMSLPLRLTQLFTENKDIHIVVLRLINILFSATSVFVFAKFFKEIGVKSHIANTGLFLYIFLPITTIVAATINYDNLIILLTALFLLYGNRVIVDGKNLHPGHVATVVSIGLLAALVKFTFLPIFVAAVIFIVAYLYRSGVGARDIAKSIKGESVDFLVVSVVVLTVLVGLAGFRYGVSMVMYMTPIPQCSQVMSPDRCAANPVIAQEEAMRDNKDRHSVVEPVQYLEQWQSSIVNNFTVTSVNTSDGRPAVERSPAIYRQFVPIVIYGAIVLILYAWTGLRKQIGWYFSLACVFSLILSTIIFNMMNYYDFHQFVGVQSRYMLNIAPIVLVFGVASASYVLRSQRVMKLSLFVLMLFITFQGGGVITHIVQSEDDWYWQQNWKSREIGDAARGVLSPVILYK